MVKDQQSRPRTVDCSVPQGSVLGPQKFNAYTEDLANLIDDHLLDHHMYADDTQLIEYTTASNIPNAIMKLQNCVESIHEWCRSRRLQLNPAKTEMIWFGSKASLKKTVHLDLNLYIGADVIKPVGVVWDLGVFLDAELNMDQHVKTVVRSCFFHLRRLKSVRRILGREVTLGLVSAFVTTRLDYCNSVLAGLPQASIDPLQRVQNAAARLVAGIGTRDHITPVLRSLHWLPIRLRIQYKLCVLMHQVHIYLVVVPHTWPTWWQPPPIYPVVKDSVPPTVSDMKPQNWNSSLVSGLSRTLDRMRGTHFRLISRNKWTLILLRNNWKLTCSSSPMNDVYDFVDAPLVT